MPELVNGTGLPQDLPVTGVLLPSADSAATTSGRTITLAWSTDDDLDHAGLSEVCRSFARELGICGGELR